jgi:hypothetical protein
MKIQEPCPRAAIAIVSLAVSASAGAADPAPSEATPAQGDKLALVSIKNQ